MSECCTLQLHFPVRSAQAHTPLSRSQVWLSDPETLHSHWVHCEKMWMQTTLSFCYQPHNRLREELPVCVLALCFTKPLNFTPKWKCCHYLLTPMSVETSLKFRPTPNTDTASYFTIWLRWQSSKKWSFFSKPWLTERNITLFLFGCHAIHENLFMIPLPWIQLHNEANIKYVWLWLYTCPFWSLQTYNT